MIRVRLLACAAAVALLSAACSQTVNGTPESPGGGSSGGTVTTRFPTDVAGLGKLLQGNSTATSAHITLDEKVGDTTVRAAGDEKVSDNTVQAMDMSESVSSTDIRFIIIGTDVYVKLPDASPIEHTKPWVRITASTTDTELQAMYSQFQASRTAGSAYSIEVFTDAARNLKLTGTGQFDGDRVGKYSMTLSVGALPSDFPNLSTIQSAGLKSIPLTLWVDDHGRTRQVTESFKVMGQSVEVKMQLTKIDDPVSISPPPAAQTETK